MQPNDQDIRDLFDEALSDVAAPADLDQRIAARNHEIHGTTSRRGSWWLGSGALAAGLALGIAGTMLFPQSSNDVVRWIEPVEMAMRGPEQDRPKPIDLSTLSRDEYLRLVADLVMAGRYEDATRVLNAYEAYFPDEPIEANR